MTRYFLKILIKKDKRGLIHITLIIGAMLAFILYKSYLISIQFEGRDVRVEPDDSYDYTTQIERLASFGLSQDVPAFVYQKGLDYPKCILSSASLSVPRLLFGVPVERIFYLNFYVGTVLLALCLAYYSHRIGGEQYAIIGLIIVMWYNGAAAWHGFFWVEGGFYLFMLALLIFAIIPYQLIEIMSTNHTV